MRIGSHLFLLLLTLAMLAGTAHALNRSVEGSATLGMQSYSGESAGETLEARSFYQQYTVKLQQQNTFYNGRAGAYTLMAGYEINRVNPSFSYNGMRDPEVSSVDTAKLYYNGTIVIAPGGLPFRLTLFASDTKQSTFKSIVSPGNFNAGLQGSNASGHLIDPNIYNDLNNGTNRTMGATLLLGIRNGTYLGAYRDILSHVPRLLIDYKQNEVKDLHGPFSRTHYLNRDLAFVSLNKKDNWVHVRMRDFQDYINPENDRMHRQIMIGTIDHRLTRQWINLTNWLKISGELSYTTEEQVDVDPKSIYNLNMMLNGIRQGMTSHVSTQFTREDDQEHVTRGASVSMAVANDFNRDTRLRTRFIFEALDHSLFTGQALSSTDLPLGDDSNSSNYNAIYLDSQLELRRSRAIAMTPRFELETRQQGDNKEGQALRVGAEVSSNRNLSKAYNWLGGYTFTMTQSNAAAKGTSVFQNEIYGRVERDLGRTLRYGGSSKLMLGSGDGRNAMPFRIATMGTGMIGHLSLFLENQYQRLGNRLGLDYEFSSVDDVTTVQTSLRNVLTYRTRNHRFDWATALTVGDLAGSSGTVKFDYIATPVDSVVNDSRVSWSSNANYFYDPNRSTGLLLAASIAGEEGGEGRIAYKLSEKFSYRFFTSNGIVRKLIEFTEEIGYEKGSGSLDDRNTSLYGRFSVDYFPTRYFYGRLRNATVVYLDNSSQQQTNSGEIGFDFEKLKFLASYTQAYKDRESIYLPESKEERWEMKVTKLF